MTQSARTVLALAILCGLGTAQSFNVDFGAGGGPASTYGGAGQVGVWNSISVPHTTPSTAPQAFDIQLVDVDGNATGVGLHQFGGTAEIDVSLGGFPPPPAGDDALLLKDALLTNSIGIKTCLYFNGLQNGTYEVITYAWMPNNASVTSIVFHDFTPGVVSVGGAWSGLHVEGVTFARHFVQVTNGFMGPHAGLPNDGDPVIGGPLNGIQLRLLDPNVTSYCTGKTNSLGCVPFVTTAGLASAATTGPFTIAGNDTLPAESGFLMYSFKKANLSFHGGKLCLKAPVQRVLPPKVAKATGGPPCTGRLARDFNARIQGGIDPLLTAGQTVSAQWFQRDPLDPSGFGDSLTDAVRFTILP